MSRWEGESHSEGIFHHSHSLHPQAAARRRFIRLRSSSSAVVCTPSWSTMASPARHPMATSSAISTITKSNQRFVEFYTILGQYTIKIDKATRSGQGRQVTQSAWVAWLAAAAPSQLLPAAPPPPPGLPAVLSPCAVAFCFDCDNSWAVCFRQPWRN